MDLKISTYHLGFLEFATPPPPPQISSKDICSIFYILVKSSMKYKYHISMILNHISIVFLECTLRKYVFVLCIIF